MCALFVACACFPEGSSGIVATIAKQYADIANICSVTLETYLCGMQHHSLRHFSSIDNMIIF